jgi:hypothetical protein
MDSDVTNSRLSADVEAVKLNSEYKQPIRIPREMKVISASPAFSPVWWQRTNSGSRG